MSPQQLIRTYILLGSLYTLAASLIWSVTTLFLLDAGLSIGEVFLANALYSGGLVAFEIPTGVVADTLGRRVSYLASIVVLGVSTVLYVVAAEAGAGIVVFSLVSVLTGLGFTFYSGALEAWLVDGLKSHGADDRLDMVFARSAQWSGAAMFVGTISGGFLGQLDLSVPFLVRSGLLVALLVLAASRMVEVGFERRPLEFRQIPRLMRDEAAAGVAFGWGQSGLRRLMLAAVARGIFFGWAFYAAQPYFLELLERDAVWVVGLVTAALSIATIVGNQLVRVFSKRCGRRSTMLIGASAVASVAGIGMGLTSSFAVAFGCLMVVAVAMGVTMPVRQAYLHQVTDSDHRATVVSFDGMVSSIGGVGGQIGLGRVADRDGYSAGYVVGGIATLVALPILVSLRRLGGPADQLVDERAEVTCPAGLPKDTGVDQHHVPTVIEDREPVAG